MGERKGLRGGEICSQARSIESMEAECTRGVGLPGQSCTLVGPLSSSSQPSKSSSLSDSSISHIRDRRKSGSERSVRALRVAINAGNKPAVVRCRKNASVPIERGACLLIIVPSPTEGLKHSYFWSQLLIIQLKTMLNFYFKCAIYR